MVSIIVVAVVAKAKYIIENISQRLWRLISVFQLQNIY